MRLHVGYRICIYLEPILDEHKAVEQPEQAQLEKRPHVGAWHRTFVFEQPAMTALVELIRSRNEPAELRTELARTLTALAHGGTTAFDGSLPVEEARVSIESAVHEGHG